MISFCRSVMRSCFREIFLEIKKIAEKRSHMMMLSAGQKSEISCLNKRIS